MLVAKGAGEQASFNDKQYADAGATLVEQAEAYKGDIVLGVRPIDPQTVKEGATTISFLYPAQNKQIVDQFAKRSITSFAMDSIPRITRAQVFDALSSMANIAGCQFRTWLLRLMEHELTSEQTDKAVLEASNVFGRFLTGQVTAAGKIPPCTVLVVGAGVAGLSAITTVCPPTIL